ncbi:MAG: peptide chain release factor N(5)-glutamine methyltransferase, partial [Granulicatella sp.]|nr:peptide chain release factor N(5)-glutamine methyltransferase [Granulicatella sp.]
YRNIAQNLKKYLLEEGQAFFEIGFQQGKAVQQLFEYYCPNREVSVHKDLSGNDRMIIVGRRK